MGLNKIRAGLSSEFSCFRFVMHSIVYIFLFCKVILCFDQQSNPSVATNYNLGELVVTWVQNTSFGLQRYAQITYPNGTAIIPAFMIQTQNAISYPVWDTIATFKDGSFVTAFDFTNTQHSVKGAFTQIFQNEGKFVPSEWLGFNETQLNNSVVFERASVAVSRMSQNFVMTCSVSVNGGLSKVYIKEFNHLGEIVAGPQIVSTIEANNELASVATLYTKGIVVAWEGVAFKRYVGSAYFQVLDASLNPFGGNTEVPKCFQQTGAFSFGPRVTSTENGFIVTSFLYKPPEDTLAVCAAVYQVGIEGTTLVANVLVNASAYQTFNYVTEVSSIFLLGGNFVVSWKVGDKDGHAYFRIFDSNGTPLTNPIPVLNVPSSQTAMTANDDSSFIIITVEESSQKLVGQRFDSSGDVIGEPFYFYT